jgi:hypothetical protein
LGGTVCLDPNLNGQPYVKIDFAAVASPVGGAGGTDYNGGLIYIELDWGTGAWVPLYSVPITATDNIDCLVYSGTQAGVVWPGPTLGGPFSPAPTGNLPTCLTSFLGMAAQLYLF